MTALHGRHDLPAERRGRDGFTRFWRESLQPTMAQAGAPAGGALSTEYAPDNFPRIPITKAGEHAFVWFAAYGSPDEYRLHRKILAEPKGWSARRPSSRRPRLTLADDGAHPHPLLAAAHGTPFKYTLDVTGDVHDFDFLDGKWTMVNRRLMKRGVGSNEDWDASPRPSPRTC
jgi:hypothetical protein